MWLIDSVHVACPEQEADLRTNDEDGEIVMIGMCWIICIVTRSRRYAASRREGQSGNLPETSLFACEDRVSTVFFRGARTSNDIEWGAARVCSPVPRGIVDSEVR